MPGRRITLRQRVEARIARRRDDAFLTREFLDLGGARQVLRVLRELTEQGKLIRLGYGVYGRAEISSLTNQPMLARLRVRPRRAAGARQTQGALGTDHMGAGLQRGTQYPGADDAARASARQPF